jgi:hypothetical protein
LVDLATGRPHIEEEIGKIIEEGKLRGRLAGEMTTSADMGDSSIATLSKYVASIINLDFKIELSQLRKG